MPATNRLVIALHLGLSILAQVKPLSSGALPKCPQLIIDKVNGKNPQLPGGPPGQFPGGPPGQFPGGPPGQFPGGPPGQIPGGPPGQFPGGPPGQFPGGPPGQYPGKPPGQRPREAWLVALSKSVSEGDAGEGRKPTPCKTVSECASGEGCIAFNCDAVLQKFIVQGCGSCSDLKDDDAVDFDEAHGVTVEGCVSGNPGNSANPANSGSPANSGNSNLKVFHVIVLLAFVAISQFPVLFQSHGN